MANNKSPRNLTADDVETRKQYDAICRSYGTSAADEESAILSIGREFLPPCAIAVLDGGEPTAEYWQWMMGQTQTAQDEHDAEYRGHATVTAETITKDQIRALRSEAQAAGDTEQVDICNHALDTSETRNRTWTVERARELCADAINAGQG